MKLSICQISFTLTLVQIAKECSTARLRSANICLSPVQAENYSLFVVFLVILLGFLCLILFS